MYPRAHLWFLLVLAVCVAGFWPSFFAHPAGNPWPHLLHGLAATAWLLLLVLQGWLAATRRLALHRRTGQVSYLLAPALFLSGWVVLFLMLAGPDHFPPGIRLKLAFYDLVTLLLFGWLYILALVHVHTVQRHARFMAATAVILLPPALARLFGGHFGLSFDGLLHLSSVIPELALVALIVDDLRKGQRRLAFPVALGVLVAMHVALGPMAASPAWQRVCEWPSLIKS